MSRFLFLLFLVSFLLIADAVPYTLTGELQSWTSSDPDFGAVTFAPGTALFSANLDLFGKPTSVATSPPSFNSWWNTPISKQATLTPFSIVMNDVGTTFDFSRPGGFTPISGASLFSFHVRGELNCVGTSCTPSNLPVSSTDDFAMYIDGAKICDITGVRSTPGTTTCIIPTLSALAGTQWTHYVDIFYARRSSSSPGALSFTLPGSAATCSIFSRSILTRNIYPFGSATAQPFGNAIFFGTASDPRPVLQLVKNTDSSSATAVYMKTPVRHQNGWSTYFKFNLTGANAEGFAFVLQSKATNGPTSGTGAGLGYSISQSLAIEFDTFQNLPPAVPSGCDNAAPHVEIHAVLGGDNTPCRTGGTSAFSFVNSSTVTPAFTNGQTYEVYIEYLPGPSSGVDGTITVWSATALSSPSLLYHASRFTVNNYLARSRISNTQYRNIFGASVATVSAGFSSSTTVGGTELFIWDWKFFSVPVDAFRTTVAPAAAGQSQVARNFMGSKSLTVTLFDACGGTVPIGTDSVTATLQSGAASGSTSISDLNNGKYDVWWWHTLAANYNLSVMVYGEPIFSGVTPSWFPSPFPVVIVPDIISAPNCFYTPANIGASNYLASDLRSVNITARDQFNNTVSTPSTGFTVFFQTFPASPPIPPSSQSGPVYLFTIGTHVAATNSRIFLRYSGADVQDSPTAPLNITAGLPPDATQTAITLIGTGLQGSIAGVPATIAFQVKDTWQNTHTTVTPFFGSASMACAPPVTDPRCSLPNAVNVTVVKGRNGDPSWFQVIWTTPIVGPCFTVNISIDPAVNNQTQLPNLPNVCVVPNSVSVLTSTVSGATEYTAGSFGSLTIQAKDAFNNSRVSDNSPLAPFTVAIGGVSTVCGGGPGNGPNVTGLSCAYSGVGGVYQVAFTPLKVRSQPVVVSLGAQSQTSSIVVVPGPGYPPADNIANLPIQFVAGEKSTISVDSFDEFGNKRLAGDDIDAFVVGMVPTSGGTATTTIPPAIPKGDGLYDIEITPYFAADYDLSVKLLSQDVANSPRPVIVRPSITNITVSVPSGPGLGGGQGNTTTFFNITTYDNYENINNFWTDVMVCDVCAPTIATCGVKPCSAQKTGTGLWTITYTAPVYDALNNAFTVRLFVAANSTANQTRLFDMSTSANGANQHAILKAAVGTACSNPPSPNNPPYHLINNTLTAGTLSYYYLYNYDAPNCQVPVNYHQNEPTYTVEFQAAVGTTKFTGSVLNDTTLTTGTQAIYNVSVIGTKAGVYRITIRGGGLETKQSEAGVYATVIPGPLDPPSCIVTQVVGTDRVVAGDAITFNITLRDAYQNLLTTSTGVSLEVNVSDPTGQNVTSKLLNFDLRAPTTAPYFTLTFAPTVAGVNRLAIYGPSYTTPGTKQLLALKTFPITVLPGPVDQPYTCFWNPHPTTGGPNNCPPAGTQPHATAGQPYPIPLFARDRFNNQITNSTLDFTLAIAGQTVRTVSSDYSGSQGRFALQFQTNKTVNPGTLTAQASEPAGLTVATTSVIVDPADLSEVTSYVTGLNRSFIAGEWTNFTLVARDIYDNEWFSTTAAALQLDVSLNGPEQASKAILSVPTKGYIASASTNPNALYKYQYIPTTASTNNLPTIEEFNVVFKYNNVELMNLVGNVPFLVYPSVPEATQTLIPALSSPLIPAGVLTTLTIQLRDRYGNTILNGSSPGFVDVKFYDGPGTQCNGVAINTSKLVPNFTNRRGYLQLNDDQDVTDLDDGRYNVTIWTAVAGPYFAGITVGGNDTTVCRQITTVFTVIPQDVNGSHSNISGSGLDPTTDVVAGTELKLSLLLKDRFDNIVNSRDQIILVGEVPNDRPDLCPTDKPLFVDGGLNNVSKFQYEDHKNGTWTLTFTPYKANDYHLIILVNTSTLSREAIGQGCHNLTVIPWYVYKWDAPPPPAPEEALTTSLRIYGKDQFDNNVTKGEHYWKLVYRRSTRDELAPYGFARSTPQQDPYEVFYNAEHYGNYTAFVTLVQDPLYSDQQKYPVATQEDETSIFIVPATCSRAFGPGTPYRCPDSDFSSLGQCFPAWTGCTGTGSDQPCPGATIKCGDGHCAASCPSGNSADAPPWASSCAGLPAEFRMSSTDCPTPRVCPQGWGKCADGRTCTKTTDGSDCPPTTPCAGGYTCANGACVKGIYDCPTDVTCSSGTGVCQDGTCVSDPNTCPSLFLCAPPNTKRCSDGSCRVNAEDCPSGTTCPRGYALCETGQCVKSVSECPSTSCPASQVHCADGTCRDNLALCPSGITCPAGRPVLCPDRSCVATSALCRQATACSNSTFPYLCPGGTCANTKEECPTLPTCPLDTPVLCEDQTCAKTLSVCDPTGGSALASRCPAHRPYNCPDGSCANSRATCPTLGVCTPDTPVRCTTASCAVAGNVCPLEDQLDCPGVLCPGGGCAPALSQCPTALTCPTMHERCSDGTCRTNCTGIKRDSSTYCDYPQYDCPGHEAGFACAVNPRECPQAPTCPFDRPIRCVDRSCAASAKLCKPAAIIAQNYVSCAANTFITAPGSCGSDLGTGSTTCPYGSVKCWDETCRLIAEDCPPEPLCTVNHPNPRFVAPYLCPDGSCARNLYRCSALTRCPKGQIRCPAYYADDVTSAEPSVKCANTLAQCANLTSPSIPLICPHGFTLCKNGACRQSCSSGQQICPLYLPWLCDDGKCTRRPGDCADPKPCGAGKQLCWDKTCPTDQETCTDSEISNPATSLNVCPLSAPYRCPNGFCGLSSATCPGVPQPRGKCGSSTPILCADGTCERSSIQCPLVKPCYGTQVRCNNGACAVNSTACPTTRVCASTEVMCPNGLCATSNATCFNELTGCGGVNTTKCDDGMCGTTCTQPPPAHGCATGTRCFDGSCSASCALPGACYPGDPAGTPCEWAACGTGTIRCANGGCASSANAPTQCKTAWNCPVTQPFRGVDGGCYNYPADGRSTALAGNPKTVALAQGKVVCSTLRPHVCKDGSCVAAVSHCPAIQPCSGTLCGDMTCATSGSCPTLQCPPGSPTLCFDGSCRRSARECGALVQAARCPSPMYQCFDGHCANSSLECVQRQYIFGSKTFSNNADHGSGACASGEFLCWNGACLLQSNTPPTPSRAELPLACPPLPGCPAEYPLRCWDGSCVNGTCPASGGTCSGERCEDGTCRAKNTCPQYAGCPTELPYYCPFAKEQCVKDQAACLAYDPEEPEVCAMNCVRDGMARAQQVTVVPMYPTLVDVVVDNEYAPITQIMFPPGAFGDDVANIVVNAATFQDLQKGKTRINSVLVDRTPAQILLSPPFYLAWKDAASTSSKKFFNLNVTVLSNIDTTLFAGSTATGSIIVTNPCQLVGIWSAQGTVPNGAGGSTSCIYNVTVTNTTMKLAPDVANLNAACPKYGYLTSTVFKVNSTNDVVTDIQQICVCSNVTKSNGTGTNAVTFTPGDLICALWTLKGTEAGVDVGVTFQANPAMQNVCPTYLQTDAYINPPPMSTYGGSDQACTGAGAGLIPPNDICLCTFNPQRGRQWACTFEQYDDRIALPPWVPESGRPNYVVTGLLPWNQIGLPMAMCYIPLPAPPLPSSNEESWWQKYGKIVLGVGISMFVLLLILACAISRLIRYRKKYHEERAEAEELREQAQELDEKHGGLGVYDDEVEMIANPLVVEMQELQKQLEQTNAHLKTQEEMDETQMAALDKERQRILEEIKRVKDAIAAQAKTNPTRVDEIPPSGAVAVGVGSGGTTASSGTGAERQEFNQGPTARRKKQDL